MPIPSPARRPRALRHVRPAVLWGVLCAALAAPTLGAQSNDRRPSVAVLPFENGALKNNAEYAPLSKGMAEMLITALAGNPGVRVVERASLQKLIDEQNLGSSDRVDKETAVRLGKLVGAHHMLTGSFLIDPKQRMRIVVRSVNTETSEIEYAESVMGKADDLLELVDQLGTKMNAGLKLPAMPIRLRPASTSGGETAVAAAPAKGGPNQFRAMMMVSRALERQDKGDVQGAVALYKSALKEYPEFGRAKTLLASAERSAGG
jgi:TolB-like protein